MDDRSHVRRRAHAPAADTPDARLGELRRVLPPAPERLVNRVLELPLLEAALTRLRAGGLDPRSALAAVGLDPDDDRLGMLERLRLIRAEDHPVKNHPADLRT
jgi:hypothetical protein